MKVCSIINLRRAREGLTLDTGSWLVPGLGKAVQADTAGPHCVWLRSDGGRLRHLTPRVGTAVDGLTRVQGVSTCRGTRRLAMKFAVMK